MPKRSAQSKIEKYTEKIRKLEEKEKRKRKVISPVDSSSSEDALDQEQIMDIPPDIQPDSPEPTPIEDGVAPNETLEDLGIPNLQEGTSASNVVFDLDPELLSALGETMSDSPEYGDPIHENLAKLWLPLLKKGMPKDNKDKLIKDYLIPDNCRLLQAPKLNAEISAAIPDMIRNRDKTLTASQQQLGFGITAINKGMDLLLKSDNKILALKHLSNGCRLLCDSHFLATQNRVKLLTPSLDKSFINIISDSERDETLFGSALSEKIKAAKAIEKQGLAIKKTARPPKPMASTSRASHQGNWNGPPRYSANRGGRGAYNRRPHMPQTTRRLHAVPTQQSHRGAMQDKPRAPAQSHQ